MSNAAKDITDAEFNDTIAQGVTLVDFWATWCGPCQMQGPVLDEVAGELGADVTIGKINVDKNQEVAGQYGVQSIPTLLLFRNGEVVERFTGLQSKDTLVSAIEGAHAKQA